MARRNKSAAIPQRQRSCLPANKELRMAIKDRHPDVKGFGLRRQVLPESTDPLVEEFGDLYRDGVIGRELNLRDQLHVTLLPRRRLERQLRRGIILGYEFGKKVAHTQREIQQAATSDLTVELGNIAVIQSRFVAFRIESPELEAERLEINELLGRAGMRGANREDQPPLHITLGESPDFIAVREQRRIARELNEVMPVGSIVSLDDLEVYPTSPMRL